MTMSWVDMRDNDDGSAMCQGSGDDVPGCDDGRRWVRWVAMCDDGDGYGYVWCQVRWCRDDDDAMGATGGAGAGACRDGAVELGMMVTMSMPTSVCMSG